MPLLNSTATPDHALGSRQRRQLRRVGCERPPEVQCEMVMFLAAGNGFSLQAMDTSHVSAAAARGCYLRYVHAA